MDVILIRHAIAEDRDPERWPDDAARPLSKAGTARFRKAAHGLANTFAAPTMLLSSPLKRAWQTAKILQDEADWPKPREAVELVPTRPINGVIALLAKATKDSAKSVALVGHEPGLSTLLAALTAGADAELSLTFKKGGAALVRFDGDIRAGRGTLLALLPPRVLRSLR